MFFDDIHPTKKPVTIEEVCIFDKNWFKQYLILSKYTYNSREAPQYKIRIGHEMVSVLSRS